MAAGPRSSHPLLQPRLLFSNPSPRFPTPRRTPPAPSPPPQSMWFASCANSILWFAFLKAMYRATLGKYLAGAITFKVTAKGLQSLKDSALRCTGNRCAGRGC